MTEAVPSGQEPRLVLGAAHSSTEYLFEAAIAIATWQERSKLKELE
jgi:hypothetical protein